MHRADHPLHRLVGTGGDIGRHLAAQVRHLALRGRHDLVQLLHLVRLVGQFRLIDHGSILADAHRPDAPTDTRPGRATGHPEFTQALPDRGVGVIRHLKVS